MAITQETGDRVRAREDVLVKKAQQNEGTGELESKILYEEADGIWLKLQGKDRKAYGSSKELKAATAYSGADNLTALLCLKHTGRLADVLTTLGPIVPADYEPMPVGLRLREVPERVGKGYNGFKHAAIPDMPWAKEMLSMKSLSRTPFLAVS